MLHARWWIRSAHPVARSANPATARSIVARCAGATCCATGARWPSHGPGARTAPFSHFRDMSKAGLGARKRKRFEPIKNASHVRVIWPSEGSGGQKRPKTLVLEGPGVRIHGSEATLFEVSAYNAPLLHQVPHLPSCKPPS